MPEIVIQSEINADIHVVFDLTRSIDIHQLSTKQTREKAVAGRTEGLINLHETVTWRAKHFGIYQTLTSVISEYERPHLLVDEMVKGVFKSFRHEHHFEHDGDRTKLTDVFDYCSPLGFLGVIADKLFLERYMRNFLIKRNHTIKEIAESERWKEFLMN